MFAGLSVLDQLAVLLSRQFLYSLAKLRVSGREVREAMQKETPTSIFTYPPKDTNDGPILEELAEGTAYQETVPPTETPPLTDYRPAVRSDHMPSDISP
jgi:hypothetical protein